MQCEVGFPYAYDFSEGLCSFCETDPSCGLEGYFKRDGSISIEPRYDAAFAFSEQTAVVQVQSKIGVIDPLGEFLIVASEFDYIGPFKEGAAPARRGESWGYVDRYGAEVIPFLYKRALPDSEGIFPVELAVRGWAFLKSDGSYLTQCKFASCESYSEGLAAVQDAVSNLWGFVDRSGNVIVQPQFTKVGAFSENQAAVYVGGSVDENDDPQGGKWGFCNSSGTITIHPSYDEVGLFRGGLARVGIGGDSFLDRRYGYITHAGDWMWQPTR